MLSNKISCFFVIAILCLICISCNQKSKRVDRILENVTSLVEQYPDSARNLLDSIISPKDLSEAQYNQYALLLIQSKDKGYKDITTDTLIYQARDYYEKNKDIKNFSLASFYCGRLLQEKKMYNEAMPYYLDAEKIGNSNLVGLANSSMGVLLSNQLMKEDAIVKFKKAIQAFNKSENRRNEIISYIDLGNCFLVESINDSAFYYYDEALRLADSYQLKKEQASVRNNLGVTYQEIGDLKKSLYYLREALQFTTSELEKARTYLNLAKTFNSKLENDSASYYIQKSLTLQKKENDTYLLTSTYNTLSQIEEKKSNYQKALEYHKNYSNSLVTILDQNSNRTVLEIQKKYDFELVKNDINKLKLERQNFSIFVTTILLILSFVAIFFYRKAIKNEQSALEAENKAFHLMEMAKTFDEKETSFRNTLLQHFGILKKAALLESHLKKGEDNQHFIKKVNEIVYGQEILNWEALYRTINDLHNGLFDKLHEKYPQLNEVEFRICCLLYAQFSSAEIAVITQLSVNTIHMKRTSIRQKIGVETYGNISNYLDSQLT